MKPTTPTKTELYGEVEKLKQGNLDTVRAAYRRALRDARDAVARLTDGDSPQHDGAIVEACDAIERLTLPPELRDPECFHSFVQPHGADGRGYLNWRACRRCGLYRKCVNGQWIDAEPPIGATA